MMTWEKRLIGFLVLSLIFIPSTLSADLLGQGGQVVKGRLMELTTKASVSTLKATASIYTMISNIENPEIDNISTVSEYGKLITERLNSSIVSLREASTLKNSEFKPLDDWLTKLNFDIISNRFMIPPTSPIWQQVVGSSIKGGREWLNQIFVLNNNLLSITKKFTQTYQKNPMPEYVWTLIHDWQSEIDRGIFLSMLFYK